VIVLSDEFYREVSEHPIPADLGAVRILASAPAVLDLFVWLSYRCYTANGRESIPVFGTRGWWARSAARSTRVPAGSPRTNGDGCA